MTRLPASVRSLKQFTAGRLNDPATDMDRQGRLGELHGESDRAAIILAVTAHIELPLEAALLMRMPNIKERDGADYKALFSGDGPLATFSAKTRLAFALGIIDRECRDEIDLAREMRNACAHARREISLDTPQLRGVCLRLMQKDIGFLRLDEAHRKRLRVWFIMKCVFMGISIVLGKKSPSLAEVTNADEPFP